MRTVISVEQSAIMDPLTQTLITTVKAVRAAIPIPGAETARRFTLGPAELAPWSEPNAVRARGQLIRERLRAHPEIASLLAALDNTIVGDIKPIYVVLKQGDDELISWETLCNAADRFIALDRRWPVGRICDPMSAVPRPPATLGRPVRLLAVISALGVQGQEKEWELIRNAAIKSRRDGMDVHLKLFVGDPRLRALIDDEITKGLVDVEVSHVDGRLVQGILDWRPNIVHFFCHGVADVSEQSLELGQGTDYIGGEKRGSVRVPTKDLIDMSMELSNPWLLTLNCCASGQAAEDLQSMAHSVVSAGFPAAVAMLEPVEAADAHEFTRAFYSTLLSSLQTIKKELEVKPAVPFEWICSMYDARAAIDRLHPGSESCRQWALPVLYVRGVEPFSFVRSHDGLEEEKVREFKLRARFIAEWLASLGPDTDEQRRRDLIAKTGATFGLPEEFWPSPDGTFPNV